MNKFYTTYIFILIVSSISAQSLRQHSVDSLDSLNKIAQKYGVLVEDIIELNPNSSEKLTPGDNLIIPNPIHKKSVSEVKEVVSYKIHRVKKNETLHSISKKYGISIDDIKQNNKQLYDYPIKYKEKLYIPKYKTRALVPHTNLRLYSVKAKEGKWRIAHNFGITVKQLEALNPDLDSVLSDGQLINVPNIKLTFSNIGDNFDYYEVQPKEGFYSIYKKFGISKDSLEKLNPILKDTGLLNGMVLKLVINKNNDAKSIQLFPKIKYLNLKTIALFLPFKANSINFDSIQIAKQQLKRDGYVRVSTEFYSGVEMALDSAKALGISVNLDVYDTEANPIKLRSLIREIEFSKYDLILGPVIAQNCTILSNSLELKKIALFSPFVKFDKRSSNLIQTIPDDEWISDKLLTHAVKDTIAHETLIISDSKSLGRLARIRSYFNDSKTIKSGFDENGVEQFYIPFEVLQKELSPGRTLVFLETSDESFASNITSMLSGLNGITIEKEVSEDDPDEEIEIEVERELILMTTNYNKAFLGNNISNENLSNLNFQFSSVYFDSETTNSFDEKYKMKYGSYPSRYSKRGFDLMLDILLRLSSSNSIYDELTTVQTQYLENKFKYIESPSGGYVNQSGFILQYQDLFLIKIED